MQKVLLLSPSSLFMGGGEKVFLEIVDNANTLEEHEIFIVAPKFIKDELENRGIYPNQNACFKSIDLIRNTDFIIRNILLLYFMRLFKLLFLLIRLRPHIIINNDDNVLFVLVVYLYIRVFRPKTKYFQNFFHMSKSNERRKNFYSLMYILSQKLVLQLLRKSTVVIVINASVERFFRQNFKNKVIRLKLGMNISDIGVLNEINKGKVENEYDIAWVGRLTISKGIMDLIEILKLAIERDATISVILIGKTSKKLKNLINEKFKSHSQTGKVSLKFLEYQEKQHVVFNNLKKANTLVLTSREEGFSFVVLEALNLKLNVICWDLPTLREIYGENLTYVKKFSIEDFSAAVIESKTKNSQINDIELDRLNRIDFSLFNSEVLDGRDSYG